MNTPTPSRLKAVVRGTVQGVGFRPFVYRLATELELHGWVSNTAQGVFVEVEGERERLERFIMRLQKEKPPRSSISSLEWSLLDPVGFSGFEIRESNDEGAKSVLVLPDIATCDQCLEEIFDPRDRRYLYPFTNCTNCGPRFSIIEALPYDRRNTSMKSFSMCPACRTEYGDPGNRRFHAQPNACPDCGPAVELWDPSGRPMSVSGEAIAGAVEMVLAGKVVAVKGVGGFHLLVDAANGAAVARLRSRKHREEKPLAVMFPCLEDVVKCCSVSDVERRLLTSPESPIVLLKRVPAGSSQPVIASAVAPGNPYLGVLLPYTPLHHILMKSLGRPVVATSGNRSEEPICTDEFEALTRLSGIADAFLVHNRPIVRHLDDSVARVLLGREMILRRARGYAPLPIDLPGENLAPMLAVGAHLKNSVTFGIGRNAFVSQHVGDLSTKESLEAFGRITKELPALYGVSPSVVIGDMHPDYLSTQHARSLGLEVRIVQHHHAHIASCMAENELNGTVLGVSWDGTGYGTDGSVWGGEFLVATPDTFRRVATFRPFRLPGGGAAIREPRRSALGMLYELLGESVFARADLQLVREFSDGELSVARQMLHKGLNAPWTTSVGRMFDGVASALGIRHKVNFEGQAAMELEFCIDFTQSDRSYPFEIGTPERSNGSRTSGCDLPQMVIDWGPMLERILADSAVGAPRSLIALSFHNTLSAAVVEIARRVQQERVVLSGGCFQNTYLAERTITELQREGFRVYWHQRVPPNDGGISLGQLYASIRRQPVSTERAMSGEIQNVSERAPA